MCRAERAWRRAEGRKRGYRGRHEKSVWANTIFIFALNLCVSCFGSDEITFFFLLWKDGNGRVLYFPLTFFLGKRKCWELFVNSWKSFEAGLWNLGGWGVCSRKHLVAFCRWRWHAAIGSACPLLCHRHAGWQEARDFYFWVLLSCSLKSGEQFNRTLHPWKHKGKESRQRQQVMQIWPRGPRGLDPAGSLWRGSRVPKPKEIPGLLLPPWIFFQEKTESMFYM